MKCPRCDSEAAEGAKSCSHCGFDFSAPPAEAQPPPAPPTRGGRRTVIAIGVRLILVLVAVNAYMFYYGPLPASQVIKNISQRVEEADTLYVEATPRSKLAFFRADSEPRKLCLGFAQPKRTWMSREGQCRTARREYFSDGESTWGYDPDLKIVWESPTETSYRTMGRDGILIPGLEIGTDGLSWEDLSVSKRPCVKVNDKKAYVLVLREGPDTIGRLHVSVRGLVPLRSESKMRFGMRKRSCYDIDKFEINQPLPPQVRFSPPPDARQVTEEEAAEMRKKKWEEGREGSTWE